MTDTSATLDALAIFENLDAKEKEHAIELFLDHARLPDCEFVLKYFVHRAYLGEKVEGYSELMLDHIANVLRLLEILAEREAKYRGLWKLDGWDGCLALARHKFLRVLRRFGRDTVFKDGESVQTREQDDIYDLINYLMFTATLQQEGRKNGTGF